MASHHLVRLQLGQRASRGGTTAGKTQKRRGKERTKIDVCSGRQNRNNERTTRSVLPRVRRRQGARERASQVNDVEKWRRRRSLAPEAKTRLRCSVTRAFHVGFALPNTSIRGKTLKFSAFSTLKNGKFYLSNNHQRA